MVDVTLEDVPSDAAPADVRMAKPAVNGVWIVYATLSGIIRRWVVPSGGKALVPESVPLAAGESVVIVAGSTITSLDDVKAAVANAIGRSVPSGRCAIVDAGTVVDVIMADPALDSVPGKVLVSSDTAIIGDLLP